MGRGNIISIDLESTGSLLIGVIRGSEEINEKMNGVAVTLH